MGCGSMSGGGKELRGMRTEQDHEAATTSTTTSTTTTTTRTTTARTTSTPSYMKTEMKNDEKLMRLQNQSRETHTAPPVEDSGGEGWKRRTLLSSWTRHHQHASTKVRSDDDDDDDDDDNKRSDDDDDDDDDDDGGGSGGGKIIASTRKSGRRNGGRAVIVPHVQQARHWDCGLACVLMALKALHLDARGGLAMLAEMCGTASIWTIDLAHLLVKMGARVKMCTLTVGANPAFAGQRFYKETLGEDGGRVRKLFQMARQEGVLVEKRRVKERELKDIVLAKREIVIVLVDKAELIYRNIAYAAPARTRTQATQYTGHYVLLADYDDDHDVYVVRDPAMGASALELDATRLETARSAFGTDEDILLVAT